MAGTSPFPIVERTITDLTTSRRGYRLIEKVIPPHCQLPKHQHDHATITLVLDGSYGESFAWDEHACTRLRVQMKPRGIPHDTRTGPRGVHMFIVETEALESPYTTSRGSRPVLLQQGVPSALALRVWANRSKPNLALEPVLGATLDALMLSIRERQERDDADLPAWIADARDQLRRLTDPAASAGALAKRLRVHPVYLARMFRRYCGCSVGTYLRRSRIDHAVASLLSDDLPLTALAQQLGYFDQSHFTNDFRRETGTTPHAFRSSARRLLI